MDHICVTHATATAMRVAIRAPGLQLNVVSAHAPHNAYDTEHQQEWWNALEEMVGAEANGVETVVCIDSNSHLADSVEGIVEEPPCSKANEPAEFFINFLKNCEMCLPATEKGKNKHIEEPTCFVNGHGVIIDFVAIPASMREQCVAAGVLQGIDLSTTKIDHQAEQALVHIREQTSINNAWSRKHICSVKALAKESVL